MGFIFGAAHEPKVGYGLGTLWVWWWSTQHWEASLKPAFWSLQSLSQRRLRSLLPFVRVSGKIQSSAPANRCTANEARRTQGSYFIKAKGLMISGAQRRSFIARLGEKKTMQTLKVAASWESDAGTSVTSERAERQGIGWESGSMGFCWGGAMPDSLAGLTVPKGGWLPLAAGGVPSAARRLQPRRALQHFHRQGGVSPAETGNKDTAWDEEPEPISTWREEEVGTRRRRFRGSDGVAAESQGKSGVGEDVSIPCFWFRFISEDV